MGAMVWTEPGEIIWAVNKCDLWDDGPDENFGTWSPDWEEKTTTLRSGCRLTISNALPAHEATYRLPQSRDCRFTVYLSIATSEEAEDPVDQV